jgi:uncharacterized protein
MKKLWLPVFITSLSFSMMSCAASFDCAKAASNTEKMICNNEAISKLDKQLASSYKQAAENSVDKDVIKKTQVEWLKQQRGCKDVECLTKAYQERLQELNTSVVVKSKSDNIRVSLPPESTIKKPLTFTLLKGEGYPLCKQYVDMLNATKYADKVTFSCERKILPEYKLFKLPVWTEITDNNEIEKIIAERTIIRRAKTSWTKEDVQSSINEDIKQLKEKKLKMYFLKDDFDKDGIQDTAYKVEMLYPVDDESEECKYQVVNYVDDGKTTVENASKMTDRDTIHYEGFSSSAHDKLFYYGDNIFNSAWYSARRSNLVVWALDANVICEISVN